MCDIYLSSYSARKRSSEPKHLPLIFIPTSKVPICVYSNLPCVEELLLASVKHNPDLFIALSVYQQAKFSPGRLI